MGAKPPEQLGESRCVRLYLGVFGRGCVCAHAVLAASPVGQWVHACGPGHAAPCFELWHTVLRGCRVRMQAAKVAEDPQRGYVFASLQVNDKVSVCACVVSRSGS